MTPTISTMSARTRRTATTHLAGALAALLLLTGVPAIAQTVSLAGDVEHAEQGESGVSSMQFRFVLSAPVPDGQQMTVTFNVREDPDAGDFAATAAAGTGCGAGADFIPQRLAGATISGGRDFIDINVTVCEDRLDEFDERFLVEIVAVSPSDIQIDRARAVGILLDDALEVDPPPSLSVIGTSCVENGAFCNFTVALSQPSGKRVQVTAVTRDKTAIGAPDCGRGRDYVSTSQVVEFGPGPTSPRGVQVIVCDDDDQADERFGLVLSNPVNAVIQTGAADALIIDDDIEPTITIQGLTTTEGNVPSLSRGESHNVQLRVSLDREYRDGITVFLRTANGSAVGGTTCLRSFAGGLGDYVSIASGAFINVPSHTLETSITVTICHDNVVEGATAKPFEAFSVQLIDDPAIPSPSAGTIAIGTASVLIADDDRATGTFELSPAEETAFAGEHVHYTLAWTVPDGRDWHDLAEIDLRLRAKGRTAIWLRWNERSNTLHLVKRARQSAGAIPGDDDALVTRLVRLDLAGSSVEASGPTGPSVTLTLDLAFRRSHKARTYTVEIAGRDDLGNEDAFVPAGTLTIEPAEGVAE